MVKIHPQVRRCCARPFCFCRKTAGQAVIADKRVLIAQVVIIWRQADLLDYRAKLPKQGHSLFHGRLRCVTDTTRIGFARAGLPALVAPHCNSRRAVEPKRQWNAALPLKS